MTRTRTNVQHDSDPAPIGHNSLASETSSPHDSKASRIRVPAERVTIWPALQAGADDMLAGDLDEEVAVLQTAGQRMPVVVRRLENERFEAIGHAQLVRIVQEHNARNPDNLLTIDIHIMRLDDDAAFRLAAQELRQMIDMFDHLTLNQRLATAAARLYALAGDPDAAFEARSGELDALIHDAEAREHRRASFNARDAACYRLGSAFEPVGALDLDSVALAGLLTLGLTGLLLLVRIALEMPDASLADDLRALFCSRAGRDIRAWGVWTRWRWLREPYVHETETFLASTAGQTSQARWRSKPPTARQRYLAAAICLDLQLELQTFVTRGEAFDWIEAQGGNPKYLNEPAKPDLAEVAELLS